MTDKEILTEYQKCVNQIDDYLEYRYKLDNAEKVRKTVLGMIDNLTKSLKTKQKGTK